MRALLQDDTAGYSDETFPVTVQVRTPVSQRCPRWTLAVTVAGVRADPCNDASQLQSYGTLQGVVCGCAAPGGILPSPGTCHGTDTGGSARSGNVIPTVINPLDHP